jgi:hypothetical protein
MNCNTELKSTDAMKWKETVFGNVAIWSCVEWECRENLKQEVFDTQRHKVRTL